MDPVFIEPVEVVDVPLPTELEVRTFFGVNVIVLLEIIELSWFDDGTCNDDAVTVGEDEDADGAEDNKIPLADIELKLFDAVMCELKQVEVYTPLLCCKINGSLRLIH